MSNTEFKPGDYVIYQNGDRFEIGKIKRIADDGAFVFYSEGETAAKTPFKCLRKIENMYTIKATTLGGLSDKTIGDCVRSMNNEQLAKLTYGLCPRDLMWFAAVRTPTPVCHPETKCFDCRLNWLNQKREESR